MESELNITPEIQSLLDILERLNELIDETPPFPQEPGAVRFGNKAYVGWFEKKDEFIDQKMNEIFPEAGIELGMYFKVGLSSENLRNAPVRKLTAQGINQIFNIDIDRAIYCQKI